MYRIISFSALLLISILNLVSVNNLTAQEDGIKLDSAYQYLNDGDLNSALRIFENHVLNNPSDFKIKLQLAYLFLQLKEEEKALNMFEDVAKNSPDEDNVITAKKEIENLEKTHLYEKLGKAYQLLNSGQNLEALTIFESYFNENRSDYKVSLQIGYIYALMNNYEKAKYYFEYVNENSKDDTLKKNAQLELSQLQKPGEENKPGNEDYSLLSNGYKYLNDREYDKAVSEFKNYLKRNPEDSKIHMQLGYLYDRQKKYQSAYNSFSLVTKYSKNTDEIEKAKISMTYLKETMYLNSPRSFDIYFYNHYETYYSNYISNFLGHLNFRIAKPLYAGFYTDIYLDSRSKPELIYNDRYFELGGFFKLVFTDWLNFEFRTGYVRELDYKKNSINFKPLLAFGKRFGETNFYKSSKTTKTDNFYFDLYGVGLYDYKFRNVFGQLQLKEVLRYLTGGYSYVEFYLGQQVLADSKRFEYNNYVDFYVGIGFKPSIQNFPVLFIEAANRNYLIDSGGSFLGDDLRSIFQVRAGFLIYYNTKL